MKATRNPSDKSARFPAAAAGDDNDGERRTNI